MREAPPACFQTQKNAGLHRGACVFLQLSAPTESASLSFSWGPRRAWVFAFPAMEGELKPNVLTGESGPLHNRTFLSVQMLFAQQHLLFTQRAVKEKAGSDLNYFPLCFPCRLLL